MHLLQTGQIEANLARLNERAKLSYLDDLIARKVAGPEKSTLPAAELDFHAAEFARLIAALESAAIESRLPESPAGREALNDLLVRLRLSSTSANSRQ